MEQGRGEPEERDGQEHGGQEDGGREHDGRDDGWVWRGGWEHVRSRGPSPLCLAAGRP